MITVPKVTNNVTFTITYIKTMTLIMTYIIRWVLTSILVALGMARVLPDLPLSDLSSLRASPPFDQYQVILLADTGVVLLTQVW